LDRRKLEFSGDKTKESGERFGVPWSFVHACPPHVGKHIPHRAAYAGIHKGLGSLIRGDIFFLCYFAFKASPDRGSWDEFAASGGGTSDRRYSCCYPSFGSGFTTTSVRFVTDKSDCSWSVDIEKGTAFSANSITDCRALGSFILRKVRINLSASALRNSSSLVKGDMAIIMAL
jgi:hypothetical protein